MPTFVDRCGTLRCLLHTVRLGDCWARATICCRHWGVVDGALTPNIRNKEDDTAKAASAASPRAAAALEQTTHTSRAALRPGTAAVVKRSAGLDCASVVL